MTTSEKAGLALILASIGVTVAMGFHPTGRDVLADAAGGGANVRDVVVHLVAIGAEVVLLLGTLVLTTKLAGQRELAVSAFVVYALAMVSLVVAAVASGLIAPGLATRVAGATGTAREAMMAMFAFNGQVNQAFALLGFSLASVAIVLWSVAMLRDGFSRGLGIYGIVSGAATLIAFAGFRFRFVLHGAGGLIMASQLLWTVWAGVLLRRMR